MCRLHYAYFIEKLVLPLLQQLIVTRCTAAAIIPSSNAA